MRIAQVGSLYENIPPAFYGGTERIISSLTEGLVAKGHDVTLFATAQAKTAAKLVSVCEEPLAKLGEGKSNFMYPLLNFSEVFSREQDFDIIHCHLSVSSDYIGLLGAQFLPKKTVFTIHFVAPALKEYADRALVFEKHKHLQFISISHAARDGFGDLNWLGTVYNGIEMNQFTFNPTPKDYVLWIGKFRAIKGTKEAIMAAKKAQTKIILAGTIEKEEAADRAYFEEEIKPLIDNTTVEFVGEKGGREKDELLGQAKALLNPISWNEPFGLVSVEAMATGTPVISFAKGALHETVADGKTGFLVNTVDEMAEKIGQIQTIDRQACRTWVEERFSAQKMVDSYEQLYTKLV